MQQPMEYIFLAAQTANVNFGLKIAYSSAANHFASTQPSIAAVEKSQSNLFLEARNQNPSNDKATLKESEEEMPPRRRGRNAAQRRKM